MEILIATNGPSFCLSVSVNKLFWEKTYFVFYKKSTEIWCSLEGDSLYKNSKSGDSIETV